MVISARVELTDDATSMHYDGLPHGFLVRAERLHALRLYLDLLEVES